MCWKGRLLSLPLGPYALKVRPQDHGAQKPAILLEVSTEPSSPASLRFLSTPTPRSGARHSRAPRLLLSLLGGPASHVLPGTQSRPRLGDDFCLFLRTWRQRPPPNLSPREGFTRYSGSCRGLGVLGLLLWLRPALGSASSGVRARPQPPGPVLACAAGPAPDLSLGHPHPSPLCGAPRPGRAQRPRAVLLRFRAADSDIAQQPGACT